jgi:hypothetical protein
MIIAVPESVKHRIHGAADLQGNPIRDLASYAKQWNDSFTSPIRQRGKSHPE